MGSPKKEGYANCSSIPKSRKLLIIGSGDFAEVAYECFLHDSAYEVVGFAVERNFKVHDTLFSLPIIAFEDVEQYFSPATHEVYVAVSFSQLNRVRKRLMTIAESKGYALASYVSSHAFVSPSAIIGRHCFIFEHNVIQPFVHIGANVVLWSGNHIGHHSVVGDHAFISSHVVLSGRSQIGRYCFMGVNSTVAHGVAIGEDCFINLGTHITRDLNANRMYRGQPAKEYEADARQYHKISTSEE